MNNKGFMMAEVIVVSSVILVTLVSLYISYNKIFSLYNQRVTYYDINTLTELAFIRDNNLYNSVVSLEPFEVVSNDFSDNSIKRTVYYIDKFDINNVNTSGINVTFKEYIEFISETVDYGALIRGNDGGDYEWYEMFIMERCVDEDKCTYAYLEKPAIEL